MEMTTASFLGFCPTTSDLGQLIRPHGWQRLKVIYKSCTPEGGLGPKAPRLGGHADSGGAAKQDNHRQHMLLGETLDQKEKLGLSGR